MCIRDSYVPVQQGGWDEFLSAPAAAGTAQDAAEALSLIHI